MTKPSVRYGEENDLLKKQVTEFARLEGRQPRVMLSSFEPHEGDEKSSDLAVFLSDLGFDVDIGPVVQGPDQLGMNALENDVDVLILFRLKQEDHPDFLSALRGFLEQEGCEEMVVFDDSCEMSGSSVLKRLRAWLSGILE
jgi:methylmalonyl-CoA mutase